MEERDELKSDEAPKGAQVSREHQFEKCAVWNARSPICA